MTQVPTDDISLEISEERHEPLAILPRKCNHSKHGWSTLEKEAYAVLVLLDCMHWLVATPSGYDLYIDHNKLS